ncbi:MAG: hypothetical protein MJZ01_03655 [Bacteroidales bacterium]|nr:hypothetical protein [Bacteroidales bacterium]
MAIYTKHFQYSGADDFDTVLDEQINDFLEKEKIEAENLISVKYEGHSTLGANTYSALVIYKK